MSVTWTDYTPRRSPVPYYRQLADFIGARVKAGDLAPGDGLPSEEQLAEWTGLGVTTVRRALAILRDAGVVETAAGIGSFIAEGERPPGP